MKKVTKYRTADGQEFDSAEVAKRHDGTLALMSVLIMSSHPKDDLELWHKRILGHATEIRDALTAYLGQLPKKKVARPVAADAVQPEAATAPADTAAFSEPTTNVTEAA